MCNCPPTDREGIRSGTGLPPSLFGPREMVSRMPRSAEQPRKPLVDPSALVTVTVPTNCGQFRSVSIKFVLPLAVQMKLNCITFVTSNNASSTDCVTEAQQ